MTYLFVEYNNFKTMLMYTSAMGFMFLYNYNAFFHNKNFQGATKLTLGMMFVGSNMLYYKYRKQLLRANLFDEYVQMRADELIKEREHLLRGEEMKKWIWFTADLNETLMHVHR